MSTRDELEEPDFDGASIEQVRGWFERAMLNLSQLPDWYKKHLPGIRQLFEDQIKTGNPQPLSTKQRRVAFRATQKVRYMIGADEVGTGAWAGPFVICAVVLPVGWDPSEKVPLVRDSKKLSPEQREQAYWKLEVAEHYIGFGWHQDIDRCGLRATLIEVYKHVLYQAVSKYPEGFFEKIIVDGDLDLGPSVKSVPKADETEPVVSVASILAKVTRDRFMANEVHPEHPKYGFDRHVGYGTKDHIAALKNLGPCAAHRMSYKPLKRLTTEKRHADAQATARRAGPLGSTQLWRPPATMASHGRDRGGG